MPDHAIIDKVVQFAFILLFPFAPSKQIMEGFNQCPTAIGAKIAMNDLLTIGLVSLVHLRQCNGKCIQPR